MIKIIVIVNTVEGRDKNTRWTRRIPFNKKLLAATKVSGKILVSAGDRNITFNIYDVCASALEHGIYAIINGTNYTLINDEWEALQNDSTWTLLN